MSDPHDRLADALAAEPLTLVEIAALKDRLDIVGEAGHILGNLRCGRPVSVDAYLACHAVKGWDPLTSRAADPLSPRAGGRVMWGWLGTILFMRRLEMGLDQRRAAKCARISLSSWSRAESGERRMCVGIFLALCAWADRHPWEMCVQLHAPPHVPRETTETH